MNLVIKDGDDDLGDGVAFLLNLVGTLDPTCGIELGMASETSTHMNRGTHFVILSNTDPHSIHC